MKLTTKFIFLTTFSFSLSIFSQATQKNPTLNNGTIDEQFEYVLKKSSNYQDYKVIKKGAIYTLKSHVNDSLEKEKKALQEIIKLTEKQKNDYLSLQQELQSVNEKLKEVTNTKDTIRLLGIPLKRNIYKTIIWSIIFLLVATLLYFIYLYKNSNKITQRYIAEYDELESEFNSFRTRSLEREQSINRKLQDEINKRKKNK